MSVYLPSLAHLALRPVCLVIGHRYYSSGPAGATCDRCWSFISHAEYERWFAKNRRWMVKR